MPSDLMSRRTFLANSALAGGAMLLPHRAFSKETPAASNKIPISCFVKFLQSMSFDDLAATIADIGFQGIEATVRKNGQILPEHAPDELPRLVEALKKRDLEVLIMASDVNRADDPLTESVLRTAAGLGIQRYRMSYYRYDLNRSVEKQIEELKPVVRDLAALNKELGIQAIYQNHAGARYLGAGIWDLHELLEGIPPEQIAFAYDARHAAVEAGLSWPVTWNLVQPKLGAVYVKNARWVDGRLENFALSEDGVVGQPFFNQLKKSKFPGPISLHVEYLPKAGVEKNIEAIRANMKTLQAYLNSSS